MILKIQGKDRVLAPKVEIADTFIKRLIGLLNKKSIDSDFALIITPCNSIHTIGMRFNIDVIFLDKDKTVVHLIKSLKPFRISPIIFNAYSVVELKEGMIEQTGITIGDKLVIE